MSKVTTIIRNIEGKNAGENMIAKEGKVTVEYIGFKIRIEIWGHNG